MRTKRVVASPEDPLPPQVVHATASMFGLLSATARVKILWLLSDEDLDVSTLAARIGESTATTSHHLGKLKLAGLVQLRRRGKFHVYAAARESVAVEVVRRALEDRLQPPHAQLRHG